jgi:hypothetical protein
MAAPVNPGAANSHKSASKPLRKRPAGADPQRSPPFARAR